MPTHHQGSADEVRALDAFVKLVRSAGALSVALHPHIHREFGLTEGQLGVLETLMHLGPLPLGQICQKILTSGSNLTTVVDNLERDGLVRRVRDEVDRRVQVVHLTAQGRALIERAYPAHAERITALMSALSPAEQSQLGRLCRKLGTAAKG
jgi:MarR family transcriptional regulator, 2-MHQ and catechol-resistance regulon repressor